MFDAPEGWDSRREGLLLIFSAPEGDAEVVVIEGLSARDAAKAADAAWKSYDSSFSRKVHLTTPNEEGKARGWDEVSTLEYETSPNEEMLVEAIVHRAGQRWTVVLIRGRLGTIIKRQAAVLALTESIAPAGFKPENFAGKEAHKLTPERVALIRQFVKESAEALRIPGVAFALAQDGKVVFQGGVGVRKIGGKTPVDEDTLFMVASNTKGMTTLLLAKLVEMGRIAWDDPVIQHYPEFRLGDDETTQKVQIRHLVCACTGLPRKDLDWILGTGLDTPPSRTFKMLAEMQPTSGFGELYQYNNQMAAAAGYIAGHVFYPDMEIGAAYDRAMAEHIFAPLKMDDTIFSIQKAMAGNHAAPHDIALDGEIVLVEQTPARGFNHTISPFRPAGAAWSSASDMIKYVLNELSAGIDPEGKRLFAEEALLERRKPTVSMGKDISYGMGLMITQSVAGIEIIRHGGSMAGYKSNILVLPDADVGAVILTNSNSGRPLAYEHFARRLVEVLYDGKPRAADRIAAAAEAGRLNRQKTASEIAFPPPDEIVASLAPAYVHPTLGMLRLKRKSKTPVFDTGLFNVAFGTKKNEDGTVSLVTNSPGFMGLNWVIGEQDGRRTLSASSGQHRYVWTEVDAKKQAGN